MHLKNMLLLLLLLLQNTIPAYLTSPDHIRDRRIVGGDLAKISQIPYLVNIRRNGHFYCGGSIISSRCVLTAAHCVDKGLAEDFVVRGGVTLLSDTEHRRMVERFFIHTEYNNRTFENDIAILRLNAKLQGTNIQPIAIGDFVPVQGDYVQVSGWGLTRENAIHPSNQMRTVHLRVLQQEKCKAFYDDYRNVTDTMFCASVPGQRDACLADSGGPAVARGRLVGVVSWGKRRECGHFDSPGIYVKVYTARKWIMNILHRHC
ncbi:trypsin alpha-like [Anastrepha ludens]|uniref:trypsin alpha-like n=1 Tax=Anastrepha ludens TaxID=28586 RepID=UPI0023B10939|nr:trypsin alpha-like [Anastrepha ludens]